MKEGGAGGINNGWGRGALEIYPEMNFLWENIY